MLIAIPMWTGWDLNINPLRDAHLVPTVDLLKYAAERVGFEPTVETSSTTVFETVPFNHSGTSPV